MDCDGPSTADVRLPVVSYHTAHLAEIHAEDSLNLYGVTMVTRIRNCEK